MPRETEHNGDASQEIAEGASRYLGRPVELPTDRPSQIAARTVGNLLPFVDVPSVSLDLPPSRRLRRSPIAAFTKSTVPQRSNSRMQNGHSKA